MSSIIIYDHDTISVQYLPEKGIIYHTVHKPFDGQIFRDALNAGTEALKHYKACKWLSDDRKTGPLPPDIAEWGAKDWNRRTIDAGWKYWAEVVPEAVVAAGTLLPVIENLYPLGLRMMVFTTVEEAIAWLDTMDC